MHKAKFWAVCVLVGVVATNALSGCGGGGNSRTGPTTGNANINLSEAESVYGSWRLVQVSGGFTGQGYPVTAETILTFGRNERALEKTSSKVILDAPFRITRTTTQFGDKKPVIDFGDANSSAPLPRVLHSVDSNTLQLGDEAADG